MNVVLLTNRHHAALGDPCLGAGEQEGDEVGLLRLEVEYLQKRIRPGIRL